MKIIIVKTKIIDEITSQRLVSESNSYRLGFFFTIFQFCILYIKHFNINALNNKFNKKIRDPTSVISNGENIVCDEFENLKQRKKFKDFRFIRMNQTPKLESSSFNPSNICYFQRIHYSVHIRRIFHPEVKYLKPEQ